MSVIRPRKDGAGSSPCSSTEDNIGKRRCVHILDEAQSVELVYNREESCYYINAEKFAGKSVKVNEKTVREFFTKIESEMSSSDRETIIKEISGH